VFLFTRLRDWLLRKSFNKKTCIAKDIHGAHARDIGVAVTRIRLPSGYEIVVIERIERDE
jgi:hypothetical protein